MFLKSRADIAIYGGAAGGGKTWALLLQPIKHQDKAEFSAVFFRRSTVQVRNPGGLWDESFRLYPGAGAEPFIASLEWRFPSGAKVKFAHLEHDKTVLEWQGAQLPLICFDELKTVTDLKLDVARMETRLDALIEHVRDLTASIRWMREPADARSSRR
ncbi:MAG TPA: terminase family protein [Caulobacteraceae bacterium]|nr:terminase family protein [Caulobacteraceae bacterium]